MWRPVGKPEYINAAIKMVVFKRLSTEGGNGFFIDFIAEIHADSSNFTMIRYISGPHDSVDHTLR